jgi:hypothetical protein
LEHVCPPLGRTGQATIVVKDDDSAHARRIAVLKYESGTTMHFDLRRIANTPKGPMYELSSVGVASATTAISKSDPDILACHVRPSAVCVAALRAGQRAPRP